MREHLRIVLGSVNDWLKFAEAKNIAALAFAGAAIGAYVRAVDIIALPTVPKYLVSAGILGLTLAAIFALISFLPTLDIPFLHTKRVPKETDNLLFFGDIAHYNLPDFLAKTKGALGQAQHDAIDEQYADQIIKNARIALRKYRLFNAACWFGLLGIGLLGGGAVLKLFS